MSCRPSQPSILPNQPTLVGGAVSSLPLSLTAPSTAAEFAEHARRQNAARMAAGLPPINPSDPNLRVSFSGSLVGGPPPAIGPAPGPPLSSPHGVSKELDARHEAARRVALGLSNAPTPHAPSMQMLTPISTAGTGAGTKVAAGAGAGKGGKKRRPSKLVSSQVLPPHYVPPSSYPSVSSQNAPPPQQHSMASYIPPHGIETQHQQQQQQSQQQQPLTTLPTTNVSIAASTTASLNPEQQKTHGQTVRQLSQSSRRPSWSEARLSTAPVRNNSAKREAVGDGSTSSSFALEGHNTSEGMSHPTEQKYGEPAVAPVLGEKLQNLCHSIDQSYYLDAEVQERLVELADRFLDKVTKDAIRLAKHRGSNCLDVVDVALALKKGYDLEVPGLGPPSVARVGGGYRSQNDMGMSGVGGVSVTGGQYGQYSMSSLLGGWLFAGKVKAPEPIAETDDNADAVGNVGDQGPKMGRSIGSGMEQPGKKKRRASENLTITM